MGLLDPPGIPKAGTTAFGRGLLTKAGAQEGRAALNSHPLLPPGYFTASGKTNGALSVMDSGQEWSSFGNTPGAIEDNAVKHHPVGTGATAAYYQVPTGGRPTRILTKGYWPSGAVNSQFTIVVPITAWGPVGGHDPSNAAMSVAGIHTSLFGNGIHTHSRWNVGTQTIYAQSDAAVGSTPALGRFANVIGRGSVWIDMWIDYDLGTITLFPPDGGKPYVVQDDAIKDDTGDWAIWEQYEWTGTTSGDPFVIEEMYFDTEPRRRDSRVATKLDVSDALAAFSASSYLVETVATSGGTKTMSADSGQVQWFTGAANHTLTLPSADIGAGLPVWIVNSSTGVITVNSSNGGLAAAISSGGVALSISLQAAPTTPGHWVTQIFATVNGAQTLTSKRIDPRVTSTTSASSLTPSYSTTDIYVYTALAANLTINAPSGTTNGGRIRYRFKDDGVSRTLTWNAIFRAIGVTLPAATTAGKWMYIDTVYNSADTRWDMTDVKIEV